MDFFIYILPIGCVSFFPISSMLRGTNQVAGFVAPFAGIVFFIISLQIFQFGIKHYSSQEADLWRQWFRYSRYGLLWLYSTGWPRLPIFTQNIFRSYYYNGFDAFFQSTGKNNANDIFPDSHTYIWLGQAFFPYASMVRRQGWFRLR
jgi:hypothetical protein